MLQILSLFMCCTSQILRAVRSATINAEREFAGSLAQLTESAPSDIGHSSGGSDMESVEGRGLRGGVRWILLALLATVALAEIVLRSMEGRLSGSLAHVAEIPGIIASAGNSERPTTLLLGNSLINNGTDLAALQVLEPEITFAKVTPDATSLRDWQCILQEHVVRQQVPALRAVVIGFAWHLLSDLATADPSRLGALFCDLGDLRDPASIGLTGSSDIGEFVLARTLHLYALRDTVRNRLFVRVIPHYERFVSDGNLVRAGGAGPSESDRAHTYNVLDRLAVRLGEKGIQLFVVAMPIQGAYEIDPGLLQLQTRGSIRLLDYRNLDGIAGSSFLDSMHLGPEGSRVLTRRLAQDLASAGLVQ